MTREFVLLLHYLGLGLFVAISVAGLILEFQYKKAPDLQTKAVLLRALRPIGLLSPLAVVIMLITGLMNMYLLDIGFTTFVWLRVKIEIFVVTVAVGVLFGVRSRKRAELVKAMLQGTAPMDADMRLKRFDRQILIFSLVMPILLLAVLFLAVQGRVGAQ